MTKISLLTYNIWFDNYHMVNRIKYICEIIIKLRPDFISLQEITLPIFTILKHKLDKYYHFSISFEMVHENYGTVILSKYPIIQHIVMKLPKTYMNRKYHHITAMKGDKLIKIVAIHLESDFKTDLKYKQLAEIFNKITEKEDVFIMGDTNMEQHIMLPDYLEDIETDYTYDSMKNTNIRGKYRSRLDRVFLNKRWKIVKKKLIGTEPIYENVYPSDHFGIFVKVSL
jgi:tyrosyl-DNA phosphodiesterase 2